MRFLNFLYDLPHFYYPWFGILDLLPFDFEISQNNQTLEGISGITAVGSATFQYNFSEPGPITVRIQNVGSTSAFTEFKTFVYQNPNTTLQTSSKSSDNNNEQDNRIIAPVGQFSSNSLITPLFLVGLVYVIIIALPVAVGVIILLYKKGII